MMDIFHIIFLIILCALSYIHGYIPWTRPYYYAKFQEYYLQVMRSRSCSELMQAQQQMTDDLIQFILSNHEELDDVFPKTPLQDHVHQMRCVDEESGTPLVFGV